MKGYGIALATVVVLSGCGTLGTEVTKDNNEIKMPHYRFVVPPDHGWHLLRPDDSNEVALLTQTLGPIVFQIKMMRNVVRDEKLRSESAQFVADDFRNARWLTKSARRGLSGPSAARAPSVARR